MNRGPPDDWRTSNFRSAIIEKLRECTSKIMTGSNTKPELIEANIYAKSNSKDEYLNNVQGVFKRIQMMRQQQQQQHHQQQNMGNNQVNPSDPMIALKNMTQPPSNPNHMQMSHPQMDQSIPQSMNRPMLQNNKHNMMPQQSMVGGPMNSGMLPQNQMMQSQGPIHQIPNSMHNGIGNSMNNTMNGPQVVNQGVVMQGSINGMSQIPSVQMGNNHMVPGSGQMRIPNNVLSQNKMNLNANINANMTNIPRQMVPQEILNAHQINQMSQHRFSNYRPNVPSPNSQPIPQSNTPINMIPSPSMVPTPSPQPGSLIVRNSAPVPSPGSVSLHTPGGPSQPIPSPLSNNSVDDQAYHDKVRDLRNKYADVLRDKLITNQKRGEQDPKIKKLLDILTLNEPKVQMDVLLKCEACLEKMVRTEDRFKIGVGPSQPLMSTKGHPLIDAINSTLQSPNSNYTLRRTFEPIMTMLNGKSLRNMPQPLKRKRVRELSDDIPEVLQGEIARLDQRFKISLDSVKQKSTKCIHLICWLDDRNLPCIPPVQITIPEDYPNSSPTCDMSPYEYGATEFLQRIQNAQQARTSKLPLKYTMSQLLDTWENSVRETCTNENVNNVIKNNDKIPIIKAN